MEAILGNRRDPSDATPHTPNRDETRGWKVVDEPARTFTRTPAPPRNRTGRTPSPGDRRSTTPTPARKAPPRLNLGEIVLAFQHDLAKNWQALLTAFVVAVGIAFIISCHAIWCYSSLPVDLYRQVDDEAPAGFHWEGSRYGLFSSLRCPNWEGASFSLVGRARADEVPPGIVMCCTADASFICDFPD